MIQPVNDDIQIGKPCKVKIVVKNKSKREHQFSLTVSGDVASTTGEVLAKHTPHQEVGKVEGGKGKGSFDYTKMYCKYILTYNEIQILTLSAWELLAAKGGV